MNKKLLSLGTFDFIKGAIVAVLVAVLTYVQQILIDGGQVSIKMIFTTSITSLIGYLIKQLMTNEQGQFLNMIGGHKKRKKPIKPVGQGFGFEGNDFDDESIVTVYTDIVSNIPVTVTLINNFDNEQVVTFAEQIEYTDFGSIYFEIETA